MPANQALAALRSYLLSKPEITGWVGQRVYVSRADVEGQLPAVVFELSGGQGPLNDAYDEIDVRLHVWSKASWSEALAVFGAVHTALRRATYLSGLPAPLLKIEGGAPLQMPEGDYYHIVSSYTVKMREAS